MRGASGGLGSTSHLYIYIWAASLQSTKTACLAEFDIHNIHSLMSGKATKEAKEDAGWRPVASLPPFPPGCPFLPHPAPTGCPSLCSRCCLDSLGATFARLLLLPHQHHLRTSSLPRLNTHTQGPYQRWEGRAAPSSQEGRGAALAGSAFPCLPITSSIHLWGPAAGLYACCCAFAEQRLPIVLHCT